MRRAVFFCFLAVCALLLSSCSDYSDFSHEYYVGEEIDKEELSKRLEETSELTNEELYFWTSSGNVYHKKESCRYLKNSEKILSGKLEKAKESGKQKPCSGCFE